ncbi:MAG: GNAT family N-acetyltransferase [Candidatus Blackburnbacteria bacterium]|nr:GNAT family N-acetyltransferase [Candidatus Blackburnbacteria bacterium]
MNREEKFQELWKLHEKWGKGFIFEETQDLTDVRYYLNLQDPSIYYNYALPIDVNQVNIEEVVDLFQKKGKAPALYLQETHQKSGLLEKAVKHGFSLDSRDTWMVLDNEQYSDTKLGVDIGLVDLKSFEDYKKIMFEVFADFPGNDYYFEMCRRALVGEISNYFNDFKAEFYLVCDAEVPVSGAGLFYSTEGNFAYLHATGTLENFRGKGYQTALIQHRVNLALNLGISNIYSLVEHGSQSWKNMIKNGFIQAQVGYILAKK